MRAIVLLFIFSITAPNLAFAACNGEACKDVAITFENNCYFVANLGNRTVGVTLGDTNRGSMASVTVTVGPGQKKMVTFFGGCFTSYVGGERAIYK